MSKSSPLSIRYAIKERVPELKELEAIGKELKGFAEFNTIAEVKLKDDIFPIHSIRFDHCKDPNAPCLVTVGGVHGLERIGSQLILAYLRSLASYLQWDDLFHQRLERMKLIFVPILNPAGFALDRRSNGNGVDLMRNAPVDSSEPVSSAKIYRGHRLHPSLPWYRGEDGEDMQVEAKALCDLIRKEVFQSPFSIALDVHSGFGAYDHIWYPYAKSTEPIPHLREVQSLKRLVDTALPNHVYQIGPQSDHYTAHGDLWDFIYDESLKNNRENILLPLTLEMGSWNWLKKNPLQAFKPMGFFHPMKSHRMRRVLRRHWPLFELLIRATYSYSRWIETRESTQLAGQRNVRESSG